MTEFDTMLDLLDHGCDGEPRWIALDAADTDAAASLVRFVAAEAERRGYLPLSAERFSAVSRTLPDAHRHRTFALLQTCRPPARPDSSVLVAATLVNPRPHVLVTVGIASFGQGSGGNAQMPVVREARAVYAPGGSRGALAAPGHEAAKHLARAERALVFAQTGRHEAAVRVAREALAAVARRNEAAAAWQIGILLGRLLLDRGHAPDAERAFAEAGAAAEASSREAAVASVWLAIARTDAGRFTEAEAVLRAVKLTGVLTNDPLSTWANAALARCLVHQQRSGEAVQLLDAEVGHELDSFFAVTILAAHARVLLSEGKAFDAGQRARAAIERADRSGNVLIQTIAETAHLRVLAAVGDLQLAGERKARVVDLAKRAHAPLRALRARVIWTGMLRRAGRVREAEIEGRKLARAASAVPMLLRQQIEEVLTAPRSTRQTIALTSNDDSRFAMSLVRIAQDEDDDQAAVRKVLGRFAGEVRAARVDLQSAASGVMSTLLSSGTGVAPSLGGRAFEAGIVVGPECQAGAWELAAPIRLGHRVIGAVATRWPMGRDAASGASVMLDLVAALLAPRIELLLTARAEAARAAVDIPELIGVSAGMSDLRRAIGRAASAPFSVLIEGESGVGKELVARAIHHLSPRRDRRFCDVNCAAIPDELVESELFGHAKGAFTGALIERPGLFEEANGGTLFLDELPDLSLRAQAKLLRVLQQGEIRRVGESFARRVDVRLVAATNRDMKEEVGGARFRQDLLYRLDVIRLRIPPLRERPEDIPGLAQHFWRVAAVRTNTRATLSHGVFTELARYQWPGNVRELQNVVSALAVAAPSRGTVRAALLPSAITGTIATPYSARLFEARRQFERRFIEVALARAAGSRTRAAAQLGISRQGLLKLMARLDVRGACDDTGH